MPTLETPEGKPVETDAEAVNREFETVMNDDGPDEQAPPKRQPRETKTDAVKPRTPRQPKAEKARTASKPAARLDDKQRADGVKGMTQIAAGMALMLGRATKKDAYKADAVTIASAADEIADACVKTAHEDPKFAAALDKVCAAGPYAALITVAVGVGSQIARNHKPALQLPGTMDPAKLLQAQAEADARQEPADVPAAA